MTNREWLETLTDEQLAIELAYFSELHPKETLQYTSSEYGVCLWLKETHVAEDDAEVKLVSGYPHANG